MGLEIKIYDTPAGGIRASQGTFSSWGGGLIALGFGPGRIGTLVSMATNSSHRVIMGKMLCPL